MSNTTQTPFVPLTLEERESWCRSYGLPMKRPVLRKMVKKAGAPVTSAGHPNNVLTVNCFFSCLSLAMTGSEIHAQAMRECVYATMLEVRSTMGCLGVEDVEQYVQERRVLGQQPTEVEVYAAAILLGTKVCVFREQEGCWHVYDPSLLLEDVLEDGAGCLYLQHDSVHFNLVVNVSQR